MMIVLASDFKTADGLVNWRAYEKARIANGELCKECKAYILNTAMAVIVFIVKV